MLGNRLFVAFYKYCVYFLFNKSNITVDKEQENKCYIFFGNNIFLFIFLFSPQQISWQNPFVSPVSGIESNCELSKSLLA